MSARLCDSGVSVPVERECLGVHPYAFYDVRARGSGWVFGHRGPRVAHLPGLVWFVGPAFAVAVAPHQCEAVYLCWMGCLKRYPRTCAALMRHAYLTPSEAGLLLRDWRQKRAARFDCDRLRPSSMWTSLDSATLGGIVRRMRRLGRPALRFNLAEVRGYLEGGRVS